jgi:hypothetical protein
MPDPIVFDELGKATSGAVFLPPLALGLAGLALHLSRRRFGGPLLAALYGWWVPREIGESYVLLLTLSGLEVVSLVQRVLRTKGNRECRADTRATVALSHA